MMFSSGGVRLFVDEKGGDGEPVIFQHGLGGDATQTREVFPRTTELRMVTLECRCHARSDAGNPNDYSLAKMTDDLSAYIERTFAQPVIVGGISMGAAIGLRLAVRQPDLVKGLILARAAWLYAAAPSNLEATALVGRLLCEHPPAEARTLFEHSEVARDVAGASPDNMASLLGYFDRKDIAAFAPLLRAIAADGPGVSATEVAAIGLPTLVIGTADDWIHPLAYARELAARIPRSVFREIPSKTRSRTDYVAGFKAALGAFCHDLATSDRNEQAAAR